ncbi:MAG: FKBP-type peptidyl-prolyl cis-trans isomerase [Terracoccus sp.]
MRLSRPSLALVAVLSLTAVAGCGTSGTSTGGATTGAMAVSTALQGTTATGPVDFKTAPKVSLGKTPITSTDIERKVLTPGTGASSTANDALKVWMSVYNGSDGKLLDDGFTTGRTALGVWLGSKNYIPGITKGLVGAKASERVAFTVPPKDAFGAGGNAQLGVKATDTLVFVADVQSVTPVSTSIDGTQTAVPAGLPTVEFKNGPTKAPTITIPKTAAPKETKQATLIEGKGATVEKGQTLIANYEGVLWRDGSVFDSSWQRGTAADFPIGSGQVIPGWDKTLVGKKVGSRVLLVIPPADGYGAKGGGGGKIKGDDVLVFVVDILGAV